MDLSEAEQMLAGFRQFLMPGKIFAEDGSLVFDSEKIVIEMVIEFFSSCRKFQETLKDENSEHVFKALICNFCILMTRTLYRNLDREHVMKVRDFTFDPILAKCEDDFQCLE